MSTSGGPQPGSEPHQPASASSLLLEVSALKTYFQLEEGTLKAVDGISFEIAREKVLGVVGESGSGKSVAAQSILRIVPPPGRIVGGRIVLHRNGLPIDLAGLDPFGRQMRAIRGRQISMIFQEPMTSLAPVYTIGSQIVEAIRLHRHASRSQARQLALDMLDRVGIPNASQRIDEYPHQLSGGLRQRAMIAMALSCAPSLLIADEPTTALDVTVQAQILDLMRGLQAELGMAVLYITHDLGVIAGISDDVVVMYLGKIVEQAAVREIFHHPAHPYTVGLLKAIPRLTQASHEPLASIPGAVPLPINLPGGCTFYPRCPWAEPGLCDQHEPPLVEVGTGHKVRCVRCQA